MKADRNVWALCFEQDVKITLSMEQTALVL